MEAQVFSDIFFTLLGLMALTEIGYFVYRFYWKKDTSDK